MVHGSDKSEALLTEGQSPWESPEDWLNRASSRPDSRATPPWSRGKERKWSPQVSAAPQHVAWVSSQGSLVLTGFSEEPLDGLDGGIGDSRCQKLPNRHLGESTADRCEFLGGERLMGRGHGWVGGEHLDSENGEGTKPS
jgi:hypothetical protein